MLECMNFLASRGHEVHAIVADANRDLIHPQVFLHKASDKAWLPAWRLPSFVRSSAATHESMQPPAEIRASFGMAAQPDSVIWLQSVHAAWLARSRRTRGFSGRWKQRLNPFHPVILSMEKRMLGGRRYRRLITLTTQERDHLSDHYAVPKDDVTLLPNGYSEHEFDLTNCLTKRQKMRGRLGFSPTDRVVIFVANEVERKGLKPLCRAVSRLNNRSVKLLVVGNIQPGSVAGELRQTGLSDRVVFVGATAHVEDYYAAADLFALPTQYEAWGLVIVEALACGLPVLTSRLAGAAVAVREDFSGCLLNDPGDVDEISGKLALLLEGRHAGREDISQSVEGYRWSKILPEYERILARSSELGFKPAPGRRGS